jgi:hypothetical protein
MGWIKEIEQVDTGVLVPYWEVISVFYSHKNQLSTLEVGGWASKEAYDDGKSPVMVKSWVIPSGLAPQLAAGAVAFVGGYAKSQPEFEGWTEP